RLHVARIPVTMLTRISCYEMVAFIECDGDESSEMWRTEATMKIGYKGTYGSIFLYCDKKLHMFVSWKGNHKKQEHGSRFFDTNTFCVGEAIISIEAESQRFTRRPNFDLNSTIHDAILVLEGEKIPVNKEILSSQSSYFMILFFSDFKESKQEEIEIKDTNPEDFHELLKIYGVSTEPTTVKNAITFLIMADKFDVHIVKDRMENFLLTTNFILIRRKFLIGEEHNLEILKSEILRIYETKSKLLASKSATRKHRIV
ncbi:hypothetical protein PENTCL1PPCAC_8248, partial [Pristionchus entomophagus]